MFGYLICNKHNLSEEQKERYQSFYCGLCRTLKKRYGEWERLCLNYDATFLAIFLASLYEPEEYMQKFHCALHPIREKEYVATRFTEYAADMTIALSYYKCKDDWNDERKHLPHYYGGILENAYKNIEKIYPRQCNVIKYGIEELSEIEKSSDAIPDQAVNCFGKIMSELFVYEEDFWSNSLRMFGFNLGKFIYLMDAVIDYKTDIKKNNYNPLILMSKKPEEMKDILEILLENVIHEFEKLPLIQDADLLRNVLYDGVWQRFYAMVFRKETSNDRRSL